MGHKYDVIYLDITLFISRTNEDGLKEAIVQMLGGECVPVDVGTFQNDMTSIKRRDDDLTLLIHLGYLAYDVIAFTAIPIIGVPD